MLCQRRAGSFSKHCRINSRTVLGVCAGSSDSSGSNRRTCAKVSVFVLRFVVRVRAYWVIGGWVLLQLYQIASQANDGVAYVAHGGGLIAGALLFVIMRPGGVRLFECIEETAAAS